MGFWNRDREGEPFKCWHEDCFPVRKPEWWEIAGNGESAKEHTLKVYGGRDRMREIVRDPKMAYSASDILRTYRNAQHEHTPDGYAWAPWKMGAPCAACGVTL